MAQHYVIVIDTDFVARKIKSITKRPTEAEDIIEYVEYLKTLSYFQGSNLGSVEISF